MPYNIILSHIIILIFFLVCVGCGIRLCIGFDIELGTKGSYGIFYFAGLPFVIFILRLAEYLLKDFNYAVLSTSVIVLVYSRKYLFSALKEIYCIQWYYLVPLYLVLMSFWCVTFEIDNFGAFTCVGSLHSVRYVNIANFIFDNNYIPILKQNFTQSIIVTMCKVLGGKLLYLSLFLTLLVSVLSLYGMTYWLLSSLCKFDKKLSVFGSFFVMFGNVSLCPLQILVIDSGSPFLLNGYSDSLSSIGTAILFCWLIFFNDTRRTLSFYFMTASVIFFWGSTCAQNILLFFVAFLVLRILNGKPLTFLWYKLLFAWGACLTFSIISGGMLTPSFLAQIDVHIDGLMSVSGSYFFPSFGITSFYPADNDLLGWTRYNSIMFASHDLKTSALEAFNSFDLVSIFILMRRMLYILFLNLLNSIWIVAYPLLGFFLMNRFRISACNNHNQILFIKFSNVLFVQGLGIVFLLSAWEWTRFAMLPYYLGMLFVVINYRTFSDKYKYGIKYLYCLSIFGPMITLLSYCSYNILRSFIDPHYSSIKDSLNMIFDLGL
jgi:hypothetical protein